MTSPTCRRDDMSTWSTAPPATPLSRALRTNGLTSSATTSHSSTSTQSWVALPRRTPLVRVTTSLRTSWPRVRVTDGGAYGCAGGRRSGAGAGRSSEATELTLILTGRPLVTAVRLNPDGTRADPRPRRAPTATACDAAYDMFAHDMCIRTEISRHPRHPTRHTVSPPQCAFTIKSAFKTLPNASFNWYRNI